MDISKETKDTPTGAKKKPGPSPLRIVLKATAFIILLALTFSHVQGVLGVSNMLVYTTARRIYDEKPGSLDAVYFGASNVHCFWEPAFGWAKAGIAVYPFSLDAEPGNILKNMIIEARKTQPDTLCIVTLNCFKKSAVKLETALRLVHYMPFSINKLNTIRTLYDAADYEPDAIWEFLFPLIRFHSRWDSTTTWDFYQEQNEIHTNRAHRSFLTKSVPLTSLVTDEDSLDESFDGSRDDLLDLLDYLKATKANTLFIIVPQVVSKNELASLTSLKDLVLAEGYPCLDLLNGIDDTNLLLKCDFKDTKHTNVHGAIKFSDYLTDYLVANYGFSDKRGQAGWKSWDKATAAYKETIAPYTLLFERKFLKRDNSLTPPKMKLTIENRTASLSWTAVPGADKYNVYRKEGATGNWKLVKKTDNATLSFVDKKLAKNTKYTYTVVPIKTVGDTSYFGRFSYKGAKGET